MPTDLTKTISLALKILNRLFSWFFIFEVLLFMLAIVLTLYGFSETYRFINLPTMAIVPGILSCFLTFHFTRRELEAEWEKVRANARNAIVQ